MTTAHAQSECLILAYTTEPTTREEANNDDIAYALHLAMKSPVSGRWEPLNDGYGIYFPPCEPHVGVDVAASALTAGENTRKQPTIHRVAREAAHSLAPEHGCVMPGVDVDLKSLIDPWLFPLHHGGFGLVATRIERGGAREEGEWGRILVATSDALIDYTTWGMLTVETRDGVHQPRVNVGGEGYTLTWLTDDGRVKSAHVDDLVAATRRDQPIAPSPTEITGVVTEIATAVTTEATTGRSRLPAHSQTAARPADLDDTTGAQIARDIPGAIPSGILAISDDVARGLVTRFGRVHHTRTDHAHLAIPAGATRDDILRAIADTRVELHYSDGSHVARPIDIDEESVVRILDAAADSTDGSAGDTVRVDVSVRVRQRHYPSPFAEERADPSIVRWDFDGRPLYLMIATEDENGNCIDPRGGHTHMPLRVAETIVDLADANGGTTREIDLLRRGDLTADARVMTGCFWAPEIHVIDGTLSILFMPCFNGEALTRDGEPNDRAGKPDMWTGRCHIMRLKTGDDGQPLDPRMPENWDKPQLMTRADGSILNPVQDISLDMTVLEDSGRHYYLWQQVGSVWIAQFDPEHPERLTTEPRQLIVPEYAWDNLIAEGPNAIVRGDTIYLLYSGANVDIDYVTGLATAPAGQGCDLEDPRCWRKLGYPIQKSGIVNGRWQLGTGHGMWTVDEDGLDLYVFHSARWIDGRYRGRDTQVRRVHWAADGIPILDMSDDEDVHPALRDTRLIVSIGGA